MKAINTAGQPDQVRPVAGEGVGVEDGALKGSLAPLSYHMIRLSVGA